MKVLVTGTTGFVRSHVAQMLLGRGGTVIGFGSLNDQYHVSLKQARLGRFIAPPYCHAGFEALWGVLRDAARTCAMQERMPLAHTETC